MPGCVSLFIISLPCLACVCVGIMYHYSHACTPAYTPVHAPPTLPLPHPHLPRPPRGVESNLLASIKQKNSKRSVTKRRRKREMKKKKKKKNRKVKNSESGREAISEITPISHAFTIPIEGRRERSIISAKYQIVENTMHWPTACTTPATTPAAIRQPQVWSGEIQWQISGSR